MGSRSAPWIRCSHCAAASNECVGIQTGASQLEARGATCCTWPSGRASDWGEEQRDAPLILEGTEKERKFSLARRGLGSVAAVGETEAGAEMRKKQDTVVSWCTPSSVTSDAESRSTVRGSGSLCGNPSRDCGGERRGLVGFSQWWSCPPQLGSHGCVY